MSLATKLNLKPGMKLKVLGRPARVDLDDVVASTSGAADGVLLFVTTLADVDAKVAPVLEAAKADRLAWVAYPKAGQLETDLNRDVLRRRLQDRGIQPVRMVAIDDLWSAMRFRPKR